MNYYEILQIKVDAEPKQIKKAYRELARAHHPDVNPNADENRMAQINEAYETLKNPVLKRIYDIELKQSILSSSEATAVMNNPTVAVATPDYAQKLMRADDTIHQIFVDVEDAYYGCTLDIPNIKIKNHKYSQKKDLKENIILEIPPGTLSGEVFIYKNKGGWAWNDSDRSDLIIKILLTGSDELN